MTKVPDQNLVNQPAVPGWVIEGRRSHYSIGYWIMFVIGMFGQAVPPSPRITYTLRNSNSGERCTVTLPGDHTAPDLVSAVTRESARPANSESRPATP